MTGSMPRRRFLQAAMSAAAATMVSRSLADHHVVSTEPSIVETNVATASTQYTPIEDFYVRNHFRPPQMPEGGTLQITGDVAKPGSWSQQDLASLPRQSLGSVLECAGNPAATVCLASNGLWEGWRLRDVLRLAEPTTAGSHLHLHGADGFSRSMPLEEALAGGLLVTHLNKRPLLPRHGAPWRVIFPGWYGMNSVKWLKGMVVAEAPLPNLGTTYTESHVREDGDVENRPLPRVQVKSVICRPATQSVVRRGAVKLDGLAWSGMGRVTRVEVSALPGGGWTPAEVTAAPGRFEWVSWRATAHVKDPGPVVFACRAFDDGGNGQPAERDQRRLDLYADNAYHRVPCVVIA